MDKPSCFLCQFSIVNLLEGWVANCVNTEVTEETKERISKEKEGGYWDESFAEQCEQYIEVGMEERIQH